MAIAWIVIGVVLLGIELHHLAFFAMFGAVGAFAGAVVAGLAPTAIFGQIAVAVGVAAVGLVVLRPYISDAFARRRDGYRIVGVHGGLVGTRGVTLDEVGAGGRGHVRLLGESWLAATDGPPIAPDTPVVITEVVGTTLTVRSVDPASE